MLVKKADDKSKRLALLEDLQKSPLLDPSQKKWLRQELIRVRKGIQGERDSAYYLDQYFKDGVNHAVLHDLRIEVDGDVAQIDHLVINRMGLIYLIETKNYSGNVAINAHGEFVVDYDGEQFGVPSPLEQSRRHERILRRLMERLEIRNRVGGAPECHHVVMFNPKSIITRPPASELDTSNVIKADQFPSWHSRFVDKDLGVGALLQAMANVRARETVKEWGEKLARQHRPDNQLSLPEFMQPKTRPAAPVPAAPVQVAATSAAPAPAEAAEPEAKRLICLHCNAKISFAEGKFCWNNAVRFKGGQYCREHQALFA